MLKVPKKLQNRPFTTQEADRTEGVEEKKEYVVRRAHHPTVQVSAVINEQ